MQFKEPVLSNSDNHSVAVFKYEPGILPTQEKGEIFSYGEQKYVPETLDVVEKVSSRHPGSGINRYVFVTDIAALSYLFTLSYKENDDVSSFSFETLAYEYARADLDEASSVILFGKMADFLETAYINSQKSFRLIEISPSSASYSVSEIEECIQEVLGKTKKYTEEDLRNNYKGSKIFDLYEEIFNKNFGDVHYNSISKANARSRYFKMKFKQFLRNWEIDEGYKNSTRFYLKRKE